MSWRTGAYMARMANMKASFQPATRRRGLWGLTLLAGQFFVTSCWAALSGGDATVLLSAYYRYVLAQQVPPQTQTLIAHAPADCQQPIQAALQEWVTGSQKRIRDDLQRQFGAQARDHFEKFVTDYANAESHGDAAFLAKLAADVGLKPPPANYGDLRRVTFLSRLKPEVEGVSRLLSEIQTWLDLKRRRTDVPSLPIWLHRSERGTPPAAPPTLATAEAASEAVDAPDSGASSTLDSFTAMRKARREKAQQQAQAGMQQVAAERAAAEQEYGAKKLAAAQAEADNIKRQAEKLAQGEKDALDQEANSWEQQLKGLVGATISAGVGAFTGTLGAQAAIKAANHVFPPPDTSN